MFSRIVLVECVDRCNGGIHSTIDTCCVAQCQKCRSATPACDLSTSDQVVTRTHVLADLGLTVTYSVQCVVAVATCSCWMCVLWIRLLCFSLTIGTYSWHADQGLGLPGLWSSLSRGN